MSTITPELFDTKFSYQLIGSVTKCEIRKIYVPFRDIFLIISSASTGETATKRTHFSAPD